VLRRGVIAAPGVIQPLPNGFKLERMLSVEELRYYTLYWDQVLIPGNNLIYVAIPDEEHWITAGAISRPRVNFQGSFKGDEITNALLGCQAMVAAEARKQAPLTDWVIHQVGQDIAVPEEIATTKEVIRVTLVNALPVPTEPVPIQELLEFKHRHRSEFAALHDAMDELYIEILKSPDPALAYQASVTRFRDSIDGVQRVTRNRFASTKKFEFSTELNLNATNVATAMAMGTVVDTLAVGFSIPWALVMGAATMLRVNLKRTRTFEAVKDNPKLAYLAKAATLGVLPRKSA
jgi:hypothetical protein